MAEEQPVWIAARLTVPRFNHLIHLCNAWSTNSIHFVAGGEVDFFFRMWLPGGFDLDDAFVDDGGQFVLLTAYLTQARADHLIGLINEWSIASSSYTHGMVVESIRNWALGGIIDDVGGGEEDGWAGGGLGGGGGDGGWGGGGGFGDGWGGGGGDGDGFGDHLGGGGGDGGWDDSDGEEDGRGGGGGGGLGDHLGGGGSGGWGPRY